MRMEYIFTKIDDDYCVSEEAFKNFLCVNKHISFELDKQGKQDKKILIFDGQKFEYELEDAVVEKSKERFFHLNVDTVGEDDEQVEKLNSFNSIIKEINGKCGNTFSINTIWNDVSSYYARKLYPEISKIENMLRKIIYLFMLKTVGSEWLRTNTPEEFKKPIEGIIEKNNKSADEIAVDWLIYADFITLVKFFAKPYSLEADVKLLFKELEQYKSEEKKGKDDKKCVAKPLTEKVFKELSDKYEPRNNWERYFLGNLSIKSPNKFSQDWGSLYAIRNDVAHGKPIDKDEYEKAMELIERYTKIFDQCIGIIDSLQTTSEEAGMVEAVAQQVIQNDTVKEEQGEEDWYRILNSLYGTDRVISSEKLAEYTSLQSSAVSLFSDFYKKYNEDNMRRMISRLSDLSKKYGKIWGGSSITNLLDQPIYIQSQLPLSPQDVDEKNENIVAKQSEDISISDDKKKAED